MLLIISVVAAIAAATIIKNIDNEQCTGYADKFTDYESEI